MDLQTFVRDSLVGLAHGVREANAQMNEGADNKPTYFILWKGHADASLVEFDVAVTVAKGGGAGAGAKVRLMVADVDVNAKGNLSHEAVSRVKFRVKVEQGIA